MKASYVKSSETLNNKLKILLLRYKREKIKWNILLSSEQIVQKKKIFLCMKKVVNSCVIIEKLQNDRKEIHKEFELSWNGSTASRVCFKGYSSKSASGEMRLCFFNCSSIISSNSSSIDIFYIPQFALSTPKNF